MGKKVFLSILIIVFALTAPLVARRIYIKLDQKNVRTMRAEYFTPHENIEVWAKEYFKNDYQGFCFIPGYFTFDAEEGGYLRDQMNYEGLLPSSFSTDENQWAILFIRTRTVGDIIKFSRGFNYPDTQVIAKINGSHNRLLICSELKKNEDLIIKLKKDEDVYQPTSITIGSK